MPQSYPMALVLPATGGGFLMRVSTTATAGAIYTAAMVATRVA